MRPIRVLFVLLVLLNMAGCAPLIIGGAVGVVGGYAISKDTIQGDSDKPYDALWSAALSVGRIKGTIKEENYTQGYIELAAEGSKVWIKVIRMTHATTRLKVSSRKYHMPNLSLAEDIFVKIMEEAR